MIYKWKDIISQQGAWKKKKKKKEMGEIQEKMKGKGNKSENQNG